jgi:transglutaminase-like putative cysteine protease
MNYRIVHQTRYLYHEPVSRCYNVARLLPRILPFQAVEASELTIIPGETDSREQSDFFGNRVNYFSIHRLHDALTVTATSHVHVRPEKRSGERHEDLSWHHVRDRMLTDRDPATLEARQFLMASPLIQPALEISAYAAQSFPVNGGLLDGVFDLMHRIHAEFEYVPGFTTITTPMDELFRYRRGVCQDFAHFAIGCLRVMGFAARYVSGYIETLPAEGKSHLRGADASHAWFAVYIPGTGWVDFDPTNDNTPRDQHITVAWGRDYSDVTPLKGIIFSSGSHELSVAVDVERMSG